MLTLTGTIRATATLGGGINRKTGEQIPKRDVLQVEGLDSRGLVQLDGALLDGDQHRVRRERLGDGRQRERPVGRAVAAGDGARAGDHSRRGRADGPAVDDPQALHAWWHVPERNPQR